MSGPSDKRILRMLLQISYKNRWTAWKLFDTFLSVRHFAGNADHPNPLRMVSTNRLCPRSADCWREAVVSPTYTTNEQNAFRNMRCAGTRSRSHDGEVWGCWHEFLNVTSINRRVKNAWPVKTVTLRSRVPSPLLCRLMLRIRQKMVLGRVWVAVHWWSAKVVQEGLETF